VLFVGQAAGNHNRWLDWVNISLLGCVLRINIFRFDTRGGVQAEVSQMSIIYIIVGLWLISVS
jgi:hypothetical protein